MRFAAFLIFGLACAGASHAAAPHCTAASGEARVPLLELYTSEGCDSCPPVDNWLRELPKRGYGSNRVAALAFHVDYWDYIGWRDPFGHARFTQRQRSANARMGSRTIYTPQLVLNGRDLRGGAARAALGERLAELNRLPARASIRLELAGTATELALGATWEPSPGSDARQAQGWVALYENNLATDVRAGENRGRRLQHDFVVRELAGPFPAGRFTQAYKLDPRWKRNDLAIAAFVQDAQTGETLQALVMPVCRAAS